MLDERRGRVLERDGVDGQGDKRYLRQIISVGNCMGTEVVGCVSSMIGSVMEVIVKLLVDFMLEERSILTSSPVQSLKDSTNDQIRLCTFYVLSFLQSFSGQR